MVRSTVRRHVFLRRQPSRRFASAEALELRLLLTTSAYDMVSLDLQSGIETVIARDEISSLQGELTSDGLPGFEGAPWKYSAPDGYAGPVAQDTVFGNDDRVLISDPKASALRRSGSMRMLKTDGDWSFCSGSMIGPFHFLTAGHCVHQGGGGANGWYSNVQVTLARNGDERWYGAANATKLTSVTGWTQNNDALHDWAVITLDRNIGSNTGWNGWWWYSNNSSLTNLSVSIAGYPSDLATQWSQATLVNDTHQIEMYQSTGNMLAPTANQLRYNGTLDTFGGMSGSSVIEDKGGTTGRVAVGVHAYGDGGDNTNEATRMREPMADIIDNLRTTDPVPTDRADLVDWDAWFHASTSVMSHTTIRPGQNFSVTSYPRNNGTLPTGNYTVSFYASTNTTISTGDRFLGSVAMGSLGEFAWSTAALNIVWPDSIPTGNYYVGWILDSASAVTEFLEGNNTGYIATQLTVDKALPDVWSGSAEGFAYTFNSVGGDFVDDTLSFDAFLNSNGDIDSYYFASDRSGTFTIDAGDLGNAVNPMVAIYDAGTGAKLGWDNDSGPGDDASISLNLSAWTRYLIAVADFEENMTGDVTLQVRAPSQTASSQVNVDAVSGDGNLTGFAMDVAEDTDYFRFIAPPNATGSLTVTVTPTGTATLDPVLVLWSDTGTELVRRNLNTSGGIETGAIANVIPGNAYRASILSNAYATLGAYNLGVDFGTTNQIWADFNADGGLNCADVDALVGVIAAATHHPTYDLTQDGLVNPLDLTRWLSDAGAVNLGAGRAYLVGDANLDGVVDGSDFGIWNAHKFQAGAGWCGGDFSADGLTDGSDFGLWNANKFTASLASQAPHWPESGVEPATRLAAGLILPRQESEAVDRVPRTTARRSGPVSTGQGEAVPGFHRAIVERMDRARIQREALFAELWS